MRHGRIARCSVLLMRSRRSTKRKIFRAPLTGSSDPVDLDGLQGLGPQFRIVLSDLSIGARFLRLTKFVAHSFPA